MGCPAREPGEQEGPCPVASTPLAYPLRYLPPPPSLVCSGSSASCSCGWGSSAKAALQAPAMSPKVHRHQQTTAAAVLQPATAATSWTGSPLPSPCAPSACCAPASPAATARRGSRCWCPLRAPRSRCAPSSAPTSSRGCRATPIAGCAARPGLLCALCRARAAASGSLPPRRRRRHTCAAGRSASCSLPAPTSPWPPSPPPSPPGAVRVPREHRPSAAVAARSGLRRARQDQARF